MILFVAGLVGMAAGYGLARWPYSARSAPPARLPVPQDGQPAELYDWAREGAA